MRFEQPARRAHRAGFSLIEVVVVLGILSVLAAMAVPGIQDMMERRRLQGFARNFGNIFQIARSQAIRTGNNHIVFFGVPGSTTDPAGTAITNATGSLVPILIVDDGSPATANCHIDVGEFEDSILLPSEIEFGVSEATVKVPTDTGTAAWASPQLSGSTASDPSDAATNWVLFRPEGATCGTIGDTGTGGAGFYFTSGGRDYAVTLAPLGSVRVHAWRPGAWTE